VGKVECGKVGRFEGLKVALTFGHENARKLRGCRRILMNHRKHKTGEDVGKFEGGKSGMGTGMGMGKVNE
jgi:hypothetical protein